MEGTPIANKAAAVPEGIARHRTKIIVVCVLIVVVGSGWMYYAMTQAAKYEEAYNKGMGAWNKRDAAAAIPELRKAAKIDDRDPELFLTIGRAELTQNQVDKALEAWNQALKRVPDFKPALFERGKDAFYKHVAGRIPPIVDKASGWLSLQPGPGSADEIAKIWVDLKPGALHSQEFLSFGKGANDFLEGRYKDAAVAFKAYADKNDWDSAAMAMVGIANHYAALPNRAESALTAALNLRSDRGWRQIRADARYLQGNYDGAKEDYTLAGLEGDAAPLFAQKFPMKGVILWLKADAGVEVNGTSVTRWADQSASKQDATPKDGGVAPTLAASSIKGKPAVAFTGGKEDYLRLPDGFEDFSGGLSMFVVGESANPPAPNEPWSFVSIATGQAGALPIEACIGGRRETEGMVFAVEDFKSASPPYVAGPAPAKEFDLWGAVEETSGATKLYKRGLEVGKHKLTLPSKLLRKRNRVGDRLQGRVAEVLLYNRSLTDLERLGVEAYLKERYFPGVPAAEKR